MVSWPSYGQDGDGLGIYTQRYANDVSAVGTETQIYTGTHSYVLYPSITGLADGGYVVSWTSADQDGSGSGIYTQLYARDGSAVGTETQINTVTTSDQQYPSITDLADVGYVVSWQSFGQDGDG